MRNVHGRRRKRGLGWSEPGRRRASLHFLFHNLQNPLWLRLGVFLDIRQTWRVFLIQLALACGYPTAYQLGSGGIAPRNPILERILPSLLHIKMMALLDEALQDYLKNTGQVPGAKYEKTLFGRVSFLGDKGLIGNDKILHSARGRRNAAVHEMLSDVSWAQLDADLLEVHCALQTLGLVGARPDFKVGGERSKLRESSEPGVLGERDFFVRAWEGSKVAGEYRWTERIYDDEPS